MGIVPGYEWDLFVSYAHLDDQPMGGEKRGERSRGWVTALKENLNCFIDQKAGRRSNIWMDERLASEARFTKPILEALERSASLLVVATPGYLGSFWCAREREGFLAALPQFLGSQRPIFIAECEELPENALPKEFGDAIPVTFWQRDRAGTAPRRLGSPLPLAADPAHSQYFERVEDLAFKVVRELKRLAAKAQGAAPEKQGGPTVFLAEVTDDLMDDYDRVRRSLEQAGFLVLPDRVYPRDTPEAFATAMREDLKTCQAFVQLVGAYPGRVRGWERSKSLAALQLDVATGAGIQLHQRRRPELKAADIEGEEHRSLVFGPKVVNDSLEIFVQDIQRAARQAREEVIEPEAELLQVFIDHDQDDAVVAHDLYQFFHGRGLTCSIPGQFSSAEEARRDLEDDLCSCDGLVVIYGHAQKEWVRQQLKETIKTVKSKDGGGKPKLPRVVLCYAAPEDEKADPGIILPNQRVVDCRHGLDSAAQRALGDFVDSLSCSPAP